MGDNNDMLATFVVRIYQRRKSKRVGFEYGSASAYRQRSVIAIKAVALLS